MEVILRRNYRDARERCDLSIGEAARALGVSARTLAGYEMGRVSPRAPIIIAMCKLYDCSPDYLLGIVEL